MIVLDEQLLGYGLAETIRRWYRGAIVSVVDLRPGTVITDQAIPVLLRTVNKPTFVTVNVHDFWRQLAPDLHFCLICIALPDKRVSELPELLRRTLATEPFRTRRKRVGKIARVSVQRIQYYTTDSWAVQEIRWDMQP